MTTPETPLPPRRLRAPLHRVATRARWYWTVRAGLGWVLPIAAVVGATVGGGAPAAVEVALPAVVFVLAALHVLVMPQWRYRVHRWEITDSAVYTQAGWFRQERRIAPLVRVQTVDTARGVFERVFGLANVTVTTASAKGPLVIDALDVAVADTIVAGLTERAQLEGGDGT